jgi:hypothetical protein
MVNLPWRRSDEDDDSEAGGDSPHADAIVVCEFQDGTLAVYDDRVVIERVSRSKFDDRTIPVDEITGVNHEKGITVGYLQVQQTGVETTSGGLLSDPVDSNTVHFGYGDRDCAERARDAILERAGG